MEQNTIQEVVEEIKSAKDQELQDTIKKWFEQTRNQGMKIGAGYISAAVIGVMEKHLKKGKDASKRDLERCIRDIYKIASIQLTQQNDLENKTNDGTASENN
jgi:formate dehydrogenase maturation protein FdhE